MTELLIIAPLTILALFVFVVAFIIYQALKTNSETVALLLEDNKHLREDILFLVSNKTEVVLPSVARQMREVEREPRKDSTIMELTDAVNMGLLDIQEEDEDGKPRVINSKQLTQ